MNKLIAFLVFLTFSFYINAQTPVSLGSTASFAALGGSTVTNTGPSVVNGNLGVSPGTAVTGFGPGIVIGGTINAGNAVAGQAQSDLTAAYNNAAGRPCPGPPLPGDIGGTTILPGVYCAASSVGITGTVTLNGNGNSSAVFIFQIGSTLTTAAGNSLVNLINGAHASNVFWQVGSSATLGTNTIFNGTILAQASITLTTGAVLNGRALARTGAVALANNAITAPPNPGAPTTLSLTCSFPSGTVGQPYVSSLVATGGVPPYIYSISAGSLPSGLSLNPSTGAITGTPTSGGAFSDTSRASDSTGNVATGSCGITVASAPAPGGLSLTCASNSGQVGQPYLSSLAAAGGVPPYTYSISAGNLPAGLALNSSTGAISGTPTAAGTFSYTSQVVDSASASAMALRRSLGTRGGRPQAANTVGAAATSSCGLFIVALAPVPPPPTPAPQSLILVSTALLCAGLYQSRNRLRKAFRRN